MIVEEKIDGSQFSFGKFNGELKIKSKSKEIFLGAPEKMFMKGIEYVASIAPDLVEGWTYRGEFLNKPKHNALAYDKTPRHNIIIFDINIGHEIYLPYEQKKIEAEKIGLETVPLIFQGELKNYDQFQDFLQTVSCLGGQKIEGVVVKNYSHFGKDKKILIGKFVSEAFKEVHSRIWGESNPGKKDILEQLIEDYKTPARWSKAVQHLNEAGNLTGTPQDIGPLIKEIGSDIFKECYDEICKKMMDWAYPHLNRGFIRGFPQWYKEELAKKQFEND